MRMQKPQASLQDGLFLAISSTRPQMRDHNHVLSVSSKQDYARPVKTRTHARADFEKNGREGWHEAHMAQSLHSSGEAKPSCTDRSGEGGSCGYLTRFESSGLCLGVGDCALVKIGGSEIG